MRQCGGKMQRGHIAWSFLASWQLEQLELSPGRRERPVKLIFFPIPALIAREKPSLAISSPRDRSWESSLWDNQLNGKKKGPRLRAPMLLSPPLHCRSWGYAGLKGEATPARTQPRGTGWGWTPSQAVGKGLNCPGTQSRLQLLCRELQSNDATSLPFCTDSYASEPGSVILV